MSHGLHGVQSQYPPNRIDGEYQTNDEDNQGLINKYFSLDRSRENGFKAEFCINLCHIAPQLNGVLGQVPHQRITE